MVALEVDWMLIVQPHERKVHWLALREREYQPIEHSNLIDIGPDDLSGRINWPSVEND